MDQLEKAQATIQNQKKQEQMKVQAAVSKQEKKDQKGERNHSPVYTEGFEREDDHIKDQSQNMRDRQRKAVILLQRLIRGRAD